MGNKAPITRAVCWKCGTQVPLRYGGDICPACGARLRSIDYDDAARKTATLRIDREKRLNALDVDRLEAEADNARWGVLRKLPFLPSRRRSTSSRSKTFGGRLPCARRSFAIAMRLR